MRKTTSNFPAKPAARPVVMNQLLDQRTLLSLTEAGRELIGRIVVAAATIAAAAS